MLEYWQRWRRAKKSGTEIDPFAVELDRVEGQRGIEEELAKRFDEPGLGERKSGFPILAFIVYPVIGILIVAIPVGVYLKRLGKQRPPAVLTVPGRINDPEIVIDETLVEDMSPKQVAEAFLAAESAEERLRVVRNPDVVRSRLAKMAEEVTGYPIEVAALHPMGSAITGGELRFHRYAVVMKSGGKRLLCVAETPQGPLVDYEAFARFGTVGHEDLMKGVPASEVRVIAGRSFFFNGPFSDEREWVAFKLSNPDWAGPVIGYAAAGTTTARLLGHIAGNSQQRVTLKLRARGESYRAGQFEIEEVLANGWVSIERDIEATWEAKRQPLAK